jgi:uncharacterized protein (TIGR02145 family)
MFDQMPGELLGGLNDSLRLLRSFGMASVELRDANMYELQLANGVSATLTFNIPASLQAEAPATIDWWSFDEAQGIWMHEGEAQRQGNQYVGLASHFSWWNCDVTEDFNDFHGTVTTTNGLPVSGGRIELLSPTLGTALTYTNSNGEFGGRVPKNEMLTLSVLLVCGATNSWDVAFSTSLESMEEPIFNTYTAEFTEYYQVVGTIVNCLGFPVEAGYVKLGAQISLTNNGSFILQVCSSGNYQIFAFDSSLPDSVFSSGLITISVLNNPSNLNNIAACSPFSGTVIDVEGNVYSTVLIGSQWWMAENLKTKHFSENSIIPEVVDTLEWINTEEPAWCKYFNSESNYLTYGSLYNWAVAADPRNVCPIGWHVPSQSEFMILVNLMGGIEIGGGKLKTVAGWNSPNAGATNQSNFSAIPGGHRFVITINMVTSAAFSNEGLYGIWWTSTSFNSEEAYNLILYSLFQAADLMDSDKSNGNSIRCLKD